MNLRIISAGAGSGKTYRLTSEMVKLLSEGVRASGIIATTFTQKAAAELQERVRVRLLQEGLNEQADQLANALIGTVHGLGVRLLQRFAFEAGVAPNVSIIAEEDQQHLFNLSLATVLHAKRVEHMEKLCDRLGLNKRDRYDWRREVRMITDIARANDFSAAVLQESKRKSFASFTDYLPEAHQQDWEKLLMAHLEESIGRLQDNEDETKKTKGAVNTLRSLHRNLSLQGYLNWHEWAKLSKIGVGAKSKEDIAALIEFTAQHHTHPQFHEDIKHFIYQLFDIAIAAIEEYDQYKKKRGLIDYTDMEVKVNQLLDQEIVLDILSSEIDLLMVDEFQDTSPIQLEIFLKLSRIATHSVWVGDPKQSIYGFRGAAPELMQAVIQKAGGIKPEDIQEYSWRSREDIVNATNAIFCKAFKTLPPEQVALKARRKKKGGPDSITKQAEPIELGHALHHWHFKHEGPGKRPPGKPWMEQCIAFTLKEFLDQKVAILPKGEAQTRMARAGDVAILCRSNAACETMAEALHFAGLNAAIARPGLLKTAEAKLILACLKYLLNPYDALAVAELLLLASDQQIEQIIEDRITFLQQQKQQPTYAQWAEKAPFIATLNQLRGQSLELSSAEMLDLILEELDLRRIIAAWGNKQSRLDNIEVLRKMALQYEEGCNRLHTAASTGGFLLWLAEKANQGLDMQSSGEHPDAVNVLTYHRSKGLEWPIVICHSLEGRLRADVWGPDIQSSQQDIDLNNVLANRWLRYWVNPYADQGRKTGLIETIADSEAQKKARVHALQEEARLLYVGITRARDYLIFPSRQLPTSWLNRVWHEGEDDFPTLDPDSPESPWEWEGQYLNIQTGVFTFPKNLDPQAAPSPELNFLEAPKGKQSYDNHHIDASTETLPDGVQVGIGSHFQYPRLSGIPEGIDQYELAKAIKAFLIAYHMDYAAPEKLEMAQGFVDRYQLEGLTPHSLVEQGTAWLDFLNKKFAPTQIIRKYPIQYIHQNRLFNTIIDYILVRDEKIIIIQNSGFSGTETARQKQRAAHNLGLWSYLSRQACKSLFKIHKTEVYIHFVLSGTLIELTHQPAS
jgi:ATP-dependent helicase/nuclease subunit A